MASTDATPVPMKGVAYRVTFPIYDADGDLVTGAAGLDSEVDKDAAGYNDCTNEATEIGSSGTYYLELTATEMNADTVSVLVKTSTSGAKTAVLILYPEEAGNIRATSLLSVGTGTGQVNLTSGKVPATFSASDVTGNVPADLQTIKARAVTDPGAGVAIGTNVAQVGSAMGAVASVTGNVGGNVAGSVASVTAPVTAGTVSDKTGYSLTTAPPTASDVATAVWGATTRTLSGFGTLVADVAAAVWAAATRTLTAFGFTITATVDEIAIAEAVDTELTTNHGAGAWGGATGSGASSVTVTVTCAGAPVVGAFVTVKNSAQTATVAGPVKTNTLGQVVFNLDDGSYKALVSTTPAYVPLAAATLTVSGTTPLALALTATTIAAPADPSLCRVYAWMRTGDGQAIAGATVKFYASDNGPADGSLLSNAELLVTSAADGYVYADLVQGAAYTVTSTYYRLRGAAIAVPSAATEKLEDLLP